MKSLPDKKETLISLFQILRELIPESDPDKFLQSVITSSIRILGADRVLIFLYNQQTGGLIFKYGINLEKGSIKEALEFSTSIIDRALKGEIIMTTDSQETDDISLADSIIKYNIKTVLCAPLLSEGKLIGVIYADTRGKSTFLDMDRRAYFLSFMDFIANVFVKIRTLRETEEELTYVKKKLSAQTLFPKIIGQSASIETVKDKIMKITSVDYPVSVLITGESGTGKELIAQAIHRAGFRSGKPYVTVNCAAIPVNLMESELFGHERGAFTGALSRKRGFFEMAEGGVMLLDEIGDLPLELQPKLLRVLQFGTFSRLGGRDQITVDVQIISATSKDLYDEMERGNFRKDLFHRLAVEIVNIPPLRERREDILLLANHFTRKFSEKMKKPIIGIDPGAQRLLKNYYYEDNNVRELRNTIERAVLNAETRRITMKDIYFSDDLLFSAEGKRERQVPKELEDSDLISINAENITGLLEEAKEQTPFRKSDKAYYRVQHQMERELILLSLRVSGWKVKTAAVLLGVNPYNFRKKMKAILSEMLEADQGDVAKMARRYRIPPHFIKAKLSDRSTQNLSRSEQLG